MKNNFKIVFYYFETYSFHAINEDSECILGDVCIKLLLIFLLFSVYLVELLF